MSAAPKGANKTMLVKDIVVDSELQNRVQGTNPAHVENLTESYKDGAKMPRLLVMKVSDRNDQHFLVGGHNRLAAAEKAGLERVAVNVLTGTWKDAVLAAAKENANHNALPRTPADKRRSVKMLLAEFGNKSNGWLAKEAGVSEGFVRLVLKEEKVERAGPTEGSDGKVRAAPSKPATVPAWRKKKLTDILADNNPLWDKIRAAKITDAGQLADVITAKTHGFTDQERKLLSEELDILRDPTAGEDANKPGRGTGGNARFAPDRFEGSFGVVVNSLDLLPKDFPDLAKSQPVLALRRLLTEAAAHVKEIVRQADAASRSAG